MIIKYFDYLSPRVTFYYKGFLSHSSIFSGILSIIAITFILILIVYFSLDLFQRNDPNTFYFNSFIEDAGLYKINKSSLFHFVSIVENIKGVSNAIQFDFQSFSVIGLQTYVDNYLGNIKGNSKGVQAFDHWIYGYCNKEVNTEGLDELLNYDFFEKSACIKAFYNSTEETYYHIGDPRFVWPEIAYGTFNELNKLYGIFIQKCNNKTIKDVLGIDYVCKTEKQINDYFNLKGGSIVIHLYFVNNYINVLNYENPNNKFFYRIENPFTQNQSASNDINFNPTLVRSHNGLILDNIREDISYMFDRNDVYISDNAGKDLYISYNFFLKNMVEYYERIYKRIQEVISSIGGINQAITIIAIYLNQLYNSFVVLSDTEILLHSSINTEKNIHKKKVNEYKELKNKMKDLEKRNKTDDIKKNSKTKKINNHKLNNNNYPNYNKTENDKSNNIFINLEEKKKNILEDKTHNNEINKDIKDIHKVDTIDKEKIKYKNENNNFLNFLCYMMTFKKQKRLFKVYENFRIKIISEEHLIRNHLNIYNLMKATEKKRHVRRSSYQLKDLIKLV